MKYLDLTFLTPQHNLACDEALLHWCEGHDGDDILRFWEPREHFAVLGYSSRIDSEVRLSACRKHRVPVLRRCSGGGAVLQGPGCLNYSLVLRLRNRPLLQDITKTNLFIMERFKQALEPLLAPKIEIQGFTDLAFGAQKFSGNAQYRKRHALLFHGTFLLDFDIALIEKLLPFPSKQPPYRRNRSHEQFLTNLNLPAATIKNALKQAWDACKALTNIPSTAIEELVTKRYSSHEWNFRF